MTYRQRVQTMCDELGINNPIQEEDVKVESLSFLILGKWQPIAGTDMNRAGRLFFQNWFAQDICPGLVNEHYWDDGLIRHFAETHFKELWDDAEEKGRALIIALKHSSAVRIHWK